MLNNSHEKRQTDFLNIKKYIETERKMLLTNNHNIEADVIGSKNSTNIIKKENVSYNNLNQSRRGSNLLVLDQLGYNLKSDAQKSAESIMSANSVESPISNLSDMSDNSHDLYISIEKNEQEKETSHENENSLSNKNNEKGLEDEQLKKEKKEKTAKNWIKIKNIIKGIFNFQKMNKNIRLYGTGEGLFNDHNPKVYITKLQRMQTIIESREETIEEQKSKVFCNCKFPLFEPNGKFMPKWNVIISFLMLYTAIIMPYRVSFMENDDANWTWVENVIDLIFFSDVLVTLNLAYYNRDDVLIKSRKEILFNYSKSWLIIDLITSFPQDLLFNTNLSNTDSSKRSSYFRLARVTRLSRMLRMIRFLKIARIFKKVAFIQRIQKFFSVNYGISRLIAFLFTTLIISHLMGCLWYILPKIYDEENWWVPNSGLQDEEAIRLYLFSLYWSLATIFTVGFGDIHAYNEVEYAMSICWMLFGVGFYSFTIGTLSSVLVNMDTRENVLKAKLEILNEFCKETKLPVKLKEKVIKVLAYNSQKNIFSWTDKQEIFNELPAYLKFEIAKSMKNGFLKDILFFSPRFDSFIAMIVPFLIPMSFQEKEFVYKKGEHPGSMYFLSVGRVHFVNTKSIPFRTMVKGCYFGEIDIILKQKRSHSVIAGEYCDTMTLSSQMYENVIAKEYPEIDNEIKTVANLRIEKNRDAERELNERLNKRFVPQEESYDKSVNDKLYTSDKQDKVDKVDKVDKIVNKNENFFEVTPDNSSDYFSESENEKIKNKVMNYRLSAVGELEYKTVGNTSDIQKIEGEKTNKNNKKSILNKMCGKNSVVNNNIHIEKLTSNDIIIEELNKYSKHQNEMLETIHSMLNKLTTTK